MSTFQAFIKAFIKGSCVDSSELQWKHCGNRIILTEINNTLASVSHQMYMELSLTACFYPNKVNWLVLQNLKPQPRTVGTYLVGFICHWTHACKFSKPVYTKILIILAVISKKKKQKKKTHHEVTVWETKYASCSPLSCESGIFIHLPLPRWRQKKHEGGS